MRKYYSGSIKKITASNAKVYDKYYEYDEKVEIAETNVIFYYNRVGTLIRKDNRFPVVLEEELYDFFQDDFKKNSEKSYTYLCVNPEELTPIKEEVKEKVRIKSIFGRN